MRTSEEILIELHSNIKEYLDKIRSQSAIDTRGIERYIRLIEELNNLGSRTEEDDRLFNERTDHLRSRLFEVLDKDGQVDFMDAIFSRIFLTKGVQDLVMSKSDGMVDWRQFILCPEVLELPDSLSEYEHEQPNFWRNMVAALKDFTSTVPVGGKLCPRGEELVASAIKYCCTQHDNVWGLGSEVLSQSYGAVVLSPADPVPTITPASAEVLRSADSRGNDYRRK